MVSGPCLSEGRATRRQVRHVKGRRTKGRQKVWRVKWLGRAKTRWKPRTKQSYCNALEKRVKLLVKGGKGVIEVEECSQSPL
jgi:hypothetical protein